MPSEPPTTNLPDSADRPTAGWLVAMTLGNFVSHALCLTVILLLFIAAKQMTFERVFADFDTELPPITQTTHDLINLVLTFWFGLVFLLVPDSIVFFSLARQSSRWRWVATVYSHAIPLLTILLFMFTMFAVLLPLAKLINDLN